MGMKMSGIPAARLGYDLLVESIQALSESQRCDILERLGECRIHKYVKIREEAPTKAKVIPGVAMEWGKMDPGKTIFFCTKCGNTIER